MQSISRSVLILSALVTLTVGAGFVWQLPWALWLWPWPDGRLSYVFIGSILAAIGAQVLWIGVRGLFAAIPGGALNMTITMGGMAFYVLTLYSRSGETRLLITGLVLWLIAVLNLWLLLVTYRLPAPDLRRTPPLVRASFRVFAMLLAVVAAALLLRVPYVFPWPLKSATSVMFGFIFLGASLYFVYGVLRPLWFNAAGQLIGFLAYDLLLLVPYTKHFANASPGHIISLTIYMVVILYSLLLALYFLLVHPPTKFGSTGDARLQATAMHPR